MEQDKSTKKNKERKIREIEKKKKVFCFRLVKTLTEIT